MSRLKLYESPCQSWRRDNRILWEYGIDYCPRIRAFTDTIRLWKIVSHDKMKSAIDYVTASHKRGRTTIYKWKLR